jgi:hypothetical protein
VDGRNRLDAIELLGTEFEFIRATRNPRKGKIIGIDSDDFDIPLSGAVRRMFDFETNPYDIVISANLHPRHFAAEQKRELITKVLKAKPEASNGQIAKQVKAGDKTVASVRRDLESTAEIPQLEKTVGKDGKKRGRPPKRKVGLAPPRPSGPEAAAPRVTASPEISVEQRRVENASLDRPGVTDLDRRVIRPGGAIRHEAMGLTQSDFCAPLIPMPVLSHSSLFLRLERGHRAHFMACRKARLVIMIVAPPYSLPSMRPTAAVGAKRISSVSAPSFRKTTPVIADRSRSNRRWWSKAHQGGFTVIG